MGKTAPRPLLVNGPSDVSRAWRGTSVMATRTPGPLALTNGYFGTPVSLAEVRAGPVSPLLRPSQSAWDTAECPVGNEDECLLNGFAVPTRHPMR